MWKFTATATRDLSHDCDLHHSSWQCQILNPLDEARDRTYILMDTSQFPFHCATTGTPYCICYDKICMYVDVYTYMLDLEHRIEGIFTVKVSQHINFFGAAVSFCVCPWFASERVQGAVTRAGFHPWGRRPPCSFELSELTVFHLEASVDTRIFVFALTESSHGGRDAEWQFMSRIGLLMFSSRSFIVSGLSFRSLIHFEFIFVYGVRECSNFILLPEAVQFS